jgi:glucose-1-phosphatase
MVTSAPQRVVCFDLGGVLVRLCQSWADACVQAALPARDPERLAGDEWRQRRREVGERYQTGLIECSAYFSGLSASIDELYSAAELERMHAAWTLEHYPGALELVRALNAQPGVTTACLSNTNHAHWLRLAGADGGREYPAVLELRHQLASHLLGCAKPDPRIYELARARFAEAGPVRPRDILFFDDLPENVSAARDAGWSAFQVDPSGDTVRQMRGILTDAGIVV